MKAFTTQINGDPGEAGSFDANEANSLMQEGKNLVESAGLTADASGAGVPDPNTFQMGQAVNRYVHKGNFYTDSGVANAYVLTLSGYRNVSALIDGIYARFISLNANTGASTVNVAGLGVKSLTLEGGGLLPSGYITPLNETHIKYNLALDRWEVIRSTGTQQQFANAAETDAGIISNKAVTPFSLGVSSKSLATNGYLRIPGGLIIQWGNSSTSAGGSATVLFPITFPNAVTIVLATDIANAATSGAANIVSSGVSPTLSQSTFYAITDTGATVSTPFNWMALGY